MKNFHMFIETVIWKNIIQNILNNKKIELKFPYVYRNSHMEKIYLKYIKLI